ncbi:MAG: SpoIIE family protein phosphatase [bacterium]|nr:SpoIIE family protein phosphatase [bacterium]
MIFFNIETPAAPKTASLPYPRMNTLEKRFSLAGKWKIKLGDSKDYSRPDFDDSNWDSISMPGSIIKYSIEKENSIEGVFWLRKKILIGKDVKKKSMGLILGTIGNADETYFNGTKIGGMGEFPPNENSMWNHPRHYLVPNKMVNREGENCIAIRIHYYLYGEMQGTLALTNFNDWSNHRISSTFLRITLNYIVMAMGVSLLIIFIIFYFRRPLSGEYLFFCLQFLCGFWIIFEVCTYWNTFGNTLNRFKVLGIAWIAVNVTHPIFLHRIYGLTRKKTEIALWIFLAATTATAPFTSTERLRSVGTAVIILALGIGLYNISCHISALYKKRPFAKLFSFFGIAVILGAIHDGFLYYIRFSWHNFDFLGYTFPYILFPVGAGFLYFGTALILVNRFITMTDEIDDLNINLENKVIKRTEEVLHAKEEIETAMVELETINERLAITNCELEKSEKRHELDMRIAANVQSSLFPKSAPASNMYDIALMFKPMACVSGDFYDFYTRGEKDDKKLEGIGLFDVSGHGISSGLITLMAKSIIFRDFTNYPDKTLNAIIDQINTELIQEIGEADSYITGLLLRFKDDAVEYVNSGHPDILYRPAKGGTIQAITDEDGQSIAGPFLGVDLMNKPFQSTSFRFNKGDYLLLYSDCLIEAKNSAGEYFEEDRLRELFRDAPGETAREILDHIMKKFYEFIDIKKQIDDDLTVILVKKC